MALSIMETYLNLFLISPLKILECLTKVSGKLNFIFKFFFHIFNYKLTKEIGSKIKKRNNIKPNS